MGFRRKVAESPRIELTPMIDVVFLLLIFFMISTTFVERPGVTIELPEGGTQQVAAERQEVQVYLTGEGDIYLQREPISLPGLQAHLNDLGQATAAQSTFLLLADKSARHGRVIELMEAARRAGFTRLAIATDGNINERLNRPPDENP